MGKAFWALVNLAFHADAVVNLGSTMAHDFAMFGKPAFYVNHMPKPSEDITRIPNSKNWSVENIYKYEHFKSMEGLTPVHWINSTEDYLKIIEIIKSKDPKIERDQRTWRNRIIGEHIFENSSNLIVDELLSLT